MAPVDAATATTALVVQTALDASSAVCMKAWTMTLQMKFNIFGCCYMVGPQMVG